MMRRIKKSIKQGRRKNKQYQLPEVIKEAMCQGVIMEQMYGAAQATMEMIYEDDPIRLTEFILENIDNIRKDMEKFNKKTLH